MNNSWAFRRKFVYLAFTIAVLVIVIVVPTFFVVYRPPTCVDGKKNQGELGIDCGGPCKLLCSAEALEPIVVWKRFFNISPGVYSATAYIQNPNVNYISKGSVGYRFRLYSDKNVLLAERIGEVEIVPNRNIPVFEPNILVGNLIPSRVAFELDKVSEWEKTDAEYPSITATDPVLSREDSTPRLSATLNNADFAEFRNVPVVAILYDVDGNAIGASRTVVEYLGRNSKQQIFFSWPQPFGKAISQRELIPIIRPLR